MLGTLKPSRDIYDDVRRQTDEVLEVLRQPAEDPDLSDAIETARVSFGKLKDEADSTLQALGRNAEWDAFTVALYGETNAGKSTIIETLRILMKEQSKAEQQKKFLEVRDRNGIDLNSLQLRDQKHQEIAACVDEIAELARRFDEIRKSQLQLEIDATTQVEKIADEIASLPLWRRALSFIWTIPAKLELDSRANELASITAETKRLSEQHDQKKKALLTRKEEAESSSNRIDSAMKELLPLEDGSIIGDGRPDFTRETIRYDFDVNGTKLVLLDVPGIEGKEDLVLEPIMHAVQMAHAVLYVTRKADPPQKGDESTGTKGTLEKIKQHLGAQTEVWTVFNKSIKSVEPLRTKQLVNEGELGGLAVLETEMRKQLGLNYAGLLQVSAYPAFLAATENLIPGGEKARARGKFLAAMDADSILLKTGFRDLVAKLSSEMAENSRLKIRRSNYNKASEVVLQLQVCVTALRKDAFAPLVNKLKREARDAVRQLDSSLFALKSRLESGAVELIDAARVNATKDIHRKVDGDLGKDEFKRALQSCVESRSGELRSKLPKSADRNVAVFQREVEGIAGQFQEHVKGFLSDASRVVKLNFDLNIKLDNGLSVAGLIGGTVGVGAGIFALANAWNPAGWTMAAVLAAIGIATSLISILKSLWSYFDSDYKKSQQKNSADENLKKVFDSLKKSYIGQLEGGFAGFEEKLTEIRLGFELPARQAGIISASLGDIEKRLAKISRRIMKDGEL